MKFQIHRSKDEKQKWYFTIIAENGEPIATSETYHNLQDCLDTISTIRGKAEKANLVINNMKT